METDEMVLVLGLIVTANAGFIWLELDLADSDKNQVQVIFLLTPPLCRPL